MHHAVTIAKAPPVSRHPGLALTLTRAMIISLFIILAGIAVAVLINPIFSDSLNNGMQ